MAVEAVEIILTLPLSPTKERKGRVRLVYDDGCSIESSLSIFSLIDGFNNTDFVSQILAWQEWGNNGS